MGSIARGGGPAITFRVSGGLALRVSLAQLRVANVINDEIADAHRRVLQVPWRSH